MSDETNELLREIAGYDAERHNQGEGERHNQGGEGYDAEHRNQGEKSWIDVLTDEIKDGSTGEKWTVEIIEMTEEEFNKLPEFTGH